MPVEGVAGYIIVLVAREFKALKPTHQPCYSAESQRQGSHCGVAQQISSMAW